MAKKASRQSGGTATPTLPNPVSVPTPTPPEVDVNPSETNGTKWVTVRIPVAEVGTDAHRPRRIDVGNMTTPQKEAAKRIERACDELSLSLDNGKKVRGYADAVKYIMEQASLEIEAERWTAQ